VWGSPRQRGTFTLPQLDETLRQAKDAGLATIYFEGGEPFTHYRLMLIGVQKAAALGFRVGIVSNGYWAADYEDAMEKLGPLVGLIEDLTLSSDAFHGGSSAPEIQNALRAAETLHIPTGLICVSPPETTNIFKQQIGQLPEGEAEVMYRGRAYVKLVPRAELFDWRGFTACPHEDLRDPGRVHLDAFGHLHLCQGVVIGNIFEKPLKPICDEYDPEAHPIIGPLLERGPVALIERYGLDHRDQYADACHLCYEMRLSLRSRFPAALAPDQVYGGTGSI
jgi:MoaA/NifB/PqqE/SkfB family radical SAM enzyme